jgi:hypothetical protein
MNLIIPSDKEFYDALIDVAEKQRRHVDGEFYSDEWDYSTDLGGEILRCTPWEICREAADYETIRVYFEGEQVFCFFTDELEGLFPPKKSLKLFNPLICTAHMIDEGLFRVNKLITDLNEDFHLIVEEPYPIYLGALPWNSYDEVPADVIFNFCGDIPELGVQKTTIIFPFLDSNNPAAIPHEEDILSFMNVASMYARKGPTFWHCHAGINRSAFMLARYLHNHDPNFEGASIDYIIDLIRRKRYDYCLSNDAFVHSLRSL